MGKFDEFKIVPHPTSTIEHRSECTPYYDAFYSEKSGCFVGGAHLPIFTAPMACIVDENNYSKFDEYGVNPIIPRTVSFEKRLELMTQFVWIAVGLGEFKQIISNNDSFDHEVFICLDMANGHMLSAIRLCKQAKQKYGSKLILMFGNIANPETYYDCAKAGIDYIRIGIGTGSGCATDDKTGIGCVPIALIRRCEANKIEVSRDFRRGVSRYNSVPKIVYDGGCDSYRDIIIALARGADYVMCGKIFAHAKEACGEIILKEVVEPEEYVETINDFKIIKTHNKLKCIEGRMYYGMSTERAQREMGNTKIKHSEGKEYWIPILYNLDDWVSQFVAAISSTMSYCDCKNLNGFIGKQEIIHITDRW